MSSSQTDFALTKTSWSLFPLQEGETPLHCAAARGNMDCVRVLLTNNAPINATDRVSDAPSGGETSVQSSTADSCSATSFSGIIGGFSIHHFPPNNMVLSSAESTFRLVQDLSKQFKIGRARGRVGVCFVSVHNKTNFCAEKLQFVHSTK